MSLWSGDGALEGIFFLRPTVIRASPLAAAAAGVGRVSVRAGYLRKVFGGSWLTNGLRSKKEAWAQEFDRVEERALDWIGVQSLRHGAQTGRSQLAPAPT